MVLLTFLSKSRVCNSSNENLIRVLWSLCICPAYILTLLQVKTIILKTVDTALLCHVYEANSKFRVHNSSNKNLIRVLWLLYTCPAYILPCCKFLIIILKTVRGIAEIQTLLCHVYKAIFQSKSRVCNSSNVNLIRALWPLCTCPAYTLTLLQVSNHYFENCRSCGDTNLTMPHV